MITTQLPPLLCTNTTVKLIKNFLTIFPHGNVTKLEMREGRRIISFSQFTACFGVFFYRTPNHTDHLFFKNWHFGLTFKYAPSDQCSHLIPAEQTCSSGTLNTIKAFKTSRSCFSLNKYVYPWLLIWAEAFCLFTGIPLSSRTIPD